MSKKIIDFQSFKDNISNKKATDIMEAIMALNEYDFVKYLGKVYCQLVKEERQEFAEEFVNVAVALRAERLKIYSINFANNKKS
jgi:hypothetical protein